MIVDVTFPFRRRDALGQFEGDYLQVGERVDLDDALAQAKINDGHAVAVDQEAEAAEGAELPEGQPAEATAPAEVDQPVRAGKAQKTAVVPVVEPGAPVAPQA